MSVRVALPYAAAIAVSLMLAPSAIRAQDSKPSAGAAEIELTPDEKAERDARKGCKVAICSAFHVRKPDGGDIACNVAKSWRKEQLQTLVSKAKVSWPWGKVRCVADIRLKREILIKAMTEPKYEAALDRHAVTCDVERDAAATTEIKFDFGPKVPFENGKALKPSLK